MTTDTKRNYVDNSAFIGAVRSLARLLQAWAAASSFVRTATRFVRGLTKAANRSAIVNRCRVLARKVRHSTGYRWLTQEPEPDGVVIDLRDTYTIGPFVALLDRVAPTLGRAWRGSLVHRLGEWLRATSQSAWVTNSRTFQLLAAALGPPDPPDEERRE